MNKANLINDSLIILAAHSGYGKLAYFNRLDELKTGDEIELNINNETLTYILKKSEEQDKIIGGIQKNPHLLFEEQMVWVNPLKESKAYYEEYSRYYPLKRSFIFCH